VTSATWAAVLGGAGVAMVANPVVFLGFGKLIILGAVGGLYSGRRAARALMMARLRKLARGTVDLSRLDSETDGQLMHVRGRVRATETLSSFLHGTPGVYRRMTFAISGRRWVHEAAVDFALIDQTGASVTVEVAGSRLLVEDVVHADYPSPAFTGRELPGSLAEAIDEIRERLSRKPEKPVSAGELMVRDGDEIEVVGYKARVVDQAVMSRLARDTPMRASLRSGRLLPLLISRAALPTER